MIARQTNPVFELRVTAPELTRVLMAVLVSIGSVGFGVWGGLPPLASHALVAVGLTMLSVALLVVLRAHLQTRARYLASQLLASFVEKDAVPSFVTDEEGAIHVSNAAANVRFKTTQSETLAGTLRAIFASPSAVLFRLQARARIDGAACEDAVTRNGHMRLAVHRLDQRDFLWRIEEIPGGSRQGRGPDAIPVPMMTVGRSGAVLFMNEAARQMAGERIKSVDRLFPSLPIRSGQINTLSTPTGSLDAIVIEKDCSVGRKELFFMPFDHEVRPGHAVAFETLPVPMIKVAPCGEILTINARAEELLGQELAQGTTLEQVMQGLGRSISDWLRDTIEGQAALQSEFLRLLRKDKEVFVQVSLSRVREKGKTVLIAVLSDATELKTLEAQFVQSQKMQAIGQLAGGVAHDFNNLLTAISGHCDLLLLRHDQGDQDYGDLVQINENANRAAALVSQLLAFSRKQTLRPEVLDLRDTLSDLTHLLNRLVGEKVTLTLSHEPVMGAIRADKRQLEQVLMNLVVNARDAMPEGGEIRIETEVLTLETHLKRDRATVPSGKYVTVRVADEGIGIETDKLPKIFEPFYTTKRTGEGTGLGLSTAYGIVKQTGAYIFADSAPGSGTVFTLYFPVFEEVEEKVAEATTRVLPVAPKHGEGVVLLVEDEAPVRAFASRALRLRGYTVLEADSAEAALETLEDDALNVDVFVTDVVMPGMDGPTWVRKALEQRPNVRVVFMSGYAEGAFSDSKPEIVDATFLPKPFSLNQLTDTVHHQLLHHQLL